MTFYLWLWKIIGPVSLILGVIFYIGYLGGELPQTMTPIIVGGIMAVIGIIIGFTGWANDTPPRMFWITGKVGLLDNKIGYALTLGVQHFMLPAAIMAVIYMAERWM